MNFRFAQFEIDTARHELRRAGAFVHIEPQVFDLIVYLVKNRERIVTKDELINSIWQGRVISDAALSARISAARRALSDSGNDQTLIRTLHKRGFRFVGDVTEDSSAPADVNSGPPLLPHTAAEDVPRLVPTEKPLPLPDKPSIAVLPFHNMSQEPEQDYFADGLTEDIITGLSRQRWFFVIARNSTFTYKGQAVDIRDVSVQLGVRYVLEGSVRKAANRVRVTGQLIDAANGNHLWAEKYDRDLDDIFALQDDYPRHRLRRTEHFDGRGGACSKETAPDHRRMGSGHAGGATHVAHEHTRAWPRAGTAPARHCTRSTLCPCACVVGVGLCDHVQS